MQAQRGFLNQIFCIFSSCSTQPQELSDRAQWVLQSARNDHPMLACASPLGGGFDRHRAARVQFKSIGMR
jgi:hypothetical protein